MQVTWIDSVNIVMDDNVGNAKCECYNYCKTTRPRCILTRTMTQEICCGPTSRREENLLERGRERETDWDCMCTLCCNERPVQSGAGCNLIHGWLYCSWVLLRVQGIFVTPSNQTDLLSYFLFSLSAASDCCHLSIMTINIIYCIYVYVSKNIVLWS